MYILLTKNTAWLTSVSHLVPLSLEDDWENALDLVDDTVDYLLLHSQTDQGLMVEHMHHLAENVSYYGPMMGRNDGYMRWEMER